MKTAHHRQQEVARIVEQGQEKASPEGLRYRKKLKARLAVERAALELVIERGYDGVTVEDMATGETKTIAADTVVLAMGTHSQEVMEASYRAAGLNAILVGSAEMPGRIAGATRDGFEKAWGFEAE